MFYEQLLLQYQSAPENINFININGTRYSLKRVKEDILNKIKNMPKLDDRPNK